MVCSIGMPLIFKAAGVSCRRGVWNVIVFVLPMLSDNLFAFNQVNTWFNSLLISAVFCVVRLIVKSRVVSSA